MQTTSFSHGPVLLSFTCFLEKNQNMLFFSPQGGASQRSRVWEGSVNTVDTEVESSIKFLSQDKSLPEKFRLKKNKRLWSHFPIGYYKIDIYGKLIKVSLCMWIVGHTPGGGMYYKVMTIKGLLRVKHR